MARRLVLVVMLVATTGLMVATASAASDGTTRVSVATDGTQANGDSTSPVTNSDGRFVAFSSIASNLVADDTNGRFDIFVRDRQSGTTERVSVASDGSQGNRDSTFPTMSADGRYVAFSSTASNLVANDTNATEDIFVHDRLTGTTQKVSVASDGTQANDRSEEPAISADGRYVAFRSSASNLVADDTNGLPDVFIHDRLTGQTQRLSVASDGTQANGASGDPSVNADGRYVAFWSDATNLVPGDANGTTDVFVRDLQQGTTERVSVASDGSQGNSWSDLASISADGRYVAMRTDASNLVTGDTNGVADIVVHDRLTGQNDRVSVASDGTQADGWSSSPSISADGRTVAFWSYGGNLISDDTNGVPDIFVHDRLTGATQRVSVAYDGTQADNWSYLVSLSGTGNLVAFSSAASNLVSGDSNNATDVFAHELTSLTPAEATQQLIDAINSIPTLSNGTKTSLIANLNVALERMSDHDSRNDVAACNNLDVFVQKVTAQAAAQHLTGSQADELIRAAVSISAALGCS